MPVGRPNGTRIHRRVFKICDVHEIMKFTDCGVLPTDSHFHHLEVGGGKILLSNVDDDVGWIFTKAGGDK